MGRSGCCWGVGSCLPWATARQGLGTRAPLRETIQSSRQCLPLSPGVTGRSPCSFRSSLPRPGRWSGAWGTSSPPRGPWVPWALAGRPPPAPPLCPAGWRSCSRRPGLWALGEVAEQQDGAAADPDSLGGARQPRTAHPHCATGQRRVTASQCIPLGSWPLQPCAPYSNYPHQAPPLPFPGLPVSSLLCRMALPGHGWAGHSHPKSSVLRRVPGSQGPGLLSGLLGQLQLPRQSWTSCVVCRGHPPIGSCQLKDTPLPKTSSMSSPGQLTLTPEDR